jgi:uncharacterized membrane protein SirB2
MKHLHTLLVVLVIGLFLYQKLSGSKYKRTARAIKILNHIVYALIILSGLGCWSR